MWRALSIAARYHDFCGGIFAMDAADGSAGVLIGGCGNGAGIQDDQIGFLSRIGRLKALGRQLAI
jgi:hypothetical protein